MPLPVLSIAQMRDWEKATWATGQTERAVIERVGKKVAEKALELTAPNSRILLLAGKGNNGQDVLAAQKHLLERKVETFQVSSPAADLDRLRQLLKSSPDLAIDGLFGIGINRPLSAEWIEFIEQINKAGLRVLAVDVPSGLDGDKGEPQGAAVRAEVTLTVGAPKSGMLQSTAWEFVGRLEVADDVGLISPQADVELLWTAPQQDFLNFPPRRSAATHKGTYGHLAIVAGSLGYHGAPILASRGAQKAQPGLITLHTTQAAYAPVASQLQAVMVSPWHDGTDLSHPWTAVLAGPGLAGRDVPEQIKVQVARLWQQSPQPVIVDASALAWLPSGPVPEGASRVITPHPGEAARLLDSSTMEVQEDRAESLRRLSEKFGHAWVVLKGHQTMVGRSTGSIYVNCSGNPWLAQGGSGDLLSGYIGGFLAQPRLQSAPLTCVRYAVWEHGRAADELQRTGRAWRVEDLAEALGNTREDGK